MCPHLIDYFLHIPHFAQCLSPLLPLSLLSFTLSNSLSLSLNQFPLSLLSFTLSNSLSPSLNQFPLSLLSFTLSNSLSLSLNQTEIAVFSLYSVQSFDIPLAGRGIVHTLHSLFKFKNTFE